jgi:hypothetical protein
MNLCMDVKMRPPAFLREPAPFVPQSIRCGGVTDLKGMLLFLAHLLRLAEKVSVVGLVGQTIHNAREGIKIYSRLAQRTRCQ